MRKFNMEDAKAFASAQIKAMVIRNGRLNLEFVQGINKMLEFLDSIPEEKDEPVHLP